MEWLEHDGVDIGALPDWTREEGEPTEGARPRGAPRLSFVLHGPGLVVHEVRPVRRASALPWGAILGHARVDGVLYLLAPRRPPHPPWFAVTDTGVADRIERVVDERRRAAAEGYRGGAPEKRASLSSRDLLDRVLSREDVPGAVEVPLGIPEPKALNHALVGLAMGAGVAINVASETRSILAGIAAAGVATLAIGGGIHWTFWRKYQRRPRILVMTPDAYVAGLDGDVIRAHRWEDIAAFRRGVHFGKDALEVVDADGQVVARVEARLFGVPLDLVIALSDAYRNRVKTERG